MSDYEHAVINWRDNIDLLATREFKAGNTHQQAFLNISHELDWDDIPSDQTVQEWFNLMLSGNSTNSNEINERFQLLLKRIIYRYYQFTNAVQTRLSYYQPAYKITQFHLHPSLRYEFGIERWWMREKECFVGFYCKVFLFNSIQNIFRK